jgi:hypothetical protein
MGGFGPQFCAEICEQQQPSRMTIKGAAIEEGLKGVLRLGQERF